MADGEAWQPYMNTNTVACPSSYKFGTQFLIEGIIYTCRDRGGKIIVDGAGMIWLDVLTDKPIYKFGQVASGYILLP